MDVGGGFFGGLPSKPQFEDYILSMASILAKYFDVNKTKLIVEPGMAVIGAPVSYVITNLLYSVSLTSITLVT